MTKKTIKKLLSFLPLLFLGISLTQAEPYIAVRTGLKCAVCHMNKSGGGKRTDYGVIYTQSRLSMKTLKPPSGATLFSNKMGESVSIGGNLRIDETRNLAYTPSSPTNDPSFVPVVEPSSRNASITEGNIYIEVALVPERLTFYMDQSVDFGGNSSPRELFGMIELPYNSFIKMGHMLLPYGLRVLDDKAFIRAQSGYTYNTHSLAAEFGIEPGPFSFILNATNTNLTSVATLVWRRFRVGTSAGVNRDETDNHLYGVFGGANLGMFTLMGEVDIIKTVTGLDTAGNNVINEKMAAMAELDVLLMKGLNFKTTYEVFNQDKVLDIKLNGQDRTTVGLEYFVTQFFQLGGFYRINRYIPQNGPKNQDNIILRAHFFF